jgi:hypothetical protein
MTLPPSQNQYPGWQPPTQPAQPIQPTPAAPVQPVSQPTTGGPAGPGKSKNIFKGPLIVLGVLILLLVVITVISLVFSKKPAKKSNNQTASSNSVSTPASQTAPTDDKTYDFIDNQQQSNMQNLATRITTNQSQDSQRHLVPATSAGWAKLNPSDIVDPITNHPYEFTTSKTPEVGQVQYVLQSVCSSSNDIIPSTLTSSFALRTQLYNGTYYCVDTSNAGH